MPIVLIAFETDGDPNTAVVMHPSFLKAWATSLTTDFDLERNGGAAELTSLLKVKSDSLIQSFINARNHPR